MTPVDYVRAGWALVPFDRGLKKPEGPNSKGWNLRQNCITNEGRAAALDLSKHNIGLAHAYSGTCAIDLDDLAEARVWLREHGVDMDALLNAPDAVMIKSRPGRGKILYKLANPLPTTTVTSPVDDHMILEFRCSNRKGTTSQDVLPPSIHPDTGQPYTWQFGVVGDFRELPELPTALHTLWLKLITVEPRERKTPATEFGSVEQEQLKRELFQQDPDVGHDQWNRILAIAHHKSGGEGWGLDLVEEWSNSGKGTHGYASREQLETKWASYGNHPNPATEFPRETKPASLDDFDIVPISPSLSEAPTSISTPAPAELASANVLNVTSIADYAETTPVQHLVEGKIEQGVVFLLVGVRKAGKTYGGLDLAYAVAQGRTWAGAQVLTPGPVLWIAAEGARSMKRRRAPQWNAHFGAANIAVYDQKADLGAAVFIELVIATVKQMGAKLVIVDSLRRASPGAKENDNDDMPKVMANCERIALETGASVGLISHASMKASIKAARGGSSIEDSAEVAFFFEKLPDGTFLMKDHFSRDDEAGSKAYPFALEQIKPEGMVAGVILKWGEPTVPQKPEKMGKYQVAIVEVLSANGRMHIDELRAAVIARFTANPVRDQRNKSFNEALDSLIAKGTVTVDGEYRHLTADFGAL